MYLLRSLMRSGVYLGMRNVIGRNRVAPFLVVGVVMVLWLVVAQGHAANLLDPPGTISGNCVSGFVCSGGDPVLCSVAVAEQSIACVTRPTSQTVADILVEGGFDKSLSDVTGGETVTVALPVIPGRGGSCPAPYVGVAFGRSFTVSTAGLCEVADVMGWFVLLGAVVMGARIIGGG